MNDNLYTADNAGQLDTLRILARARRRITYDCLHAKTDGERVRCKTGVALSDVSKDGSAAITLVLRGIQLKPCADCLAFQDVTNSQCELCAKGIKHIH